MVDFWAPLVVVEESGAPWGTGCHGTVPLSCTGGYKDGSTEVRSTQLPIHPTDGRVERGGRVNGARLSTPIQNRSQYSQIQLPQPQPALKINPIHRPKHGVWGGPIVDEVAFASPEPACAKGGGVHGHTRRRHAISGACVVLTSPVAHPSPAETSKRQWATSPL